jgi:formiminotetrahydrofolate cyclodeaminase
MAAPWKVLAGMIALIVICVEPAYAAEAPKASTREDRSAVERIGEAAENVGKKIEKAVTGVVKKVEEQRVGERLRETIKNAATRIGEELERIGKKIEEKFSK